MIAIDSTFLRCNFKTTNKKEKNLINIIIMTERQIYLQYTI